MTSRYSGDVANWFTNDEYLMNSRQRPLL